MFGIVKKPCRLHNHELSEEWMKYMCGSCLAIKEDAGQFNRLTLNNDAILLAILVDAQRDLPAQTVTANRCVLRGMRTAQVVESSSIVARTGAAMSMILAGAKIKDDLNDQDKAYVKIPGIKYLANHVYKASADLADQVGLDLQELVRIIELEDFYQKNLNYVAARKTMEDAYAFVFRSAALLAKRPENELVCKEFGSALGSITSLVDAFEDVAKDKKNFRFNLLGDIESDHLVSWMISQMRTQFDRIYAAIFKMKLRDEQLLLHTIQKTENSVGVIVGSESHNNLVGNCQIIGESEIRRRYKLVSFNAATRMSGCGVGCDCCDCCC